VIKIIISLLLVILLYGCNNHETKKDEINECPTYQISERCIALLAYGLLSDDENDIPFGGSCKDGISDSLVTFLQSQKRIFKQWQNNKELDTNELQSNWDSKNDINLLRLLILTRITMESGVRGKTWMLNLGFAKEEYGSDYSFIWRLYMLGFANDGIYKSSFSLDTLVHIESFSNFAAYLDSSFFYLPDTPLGSVSNWCQHVKKYANELKMFSNEDFLLKYYNSRCKNEDALF
jgi:hypothetical protein